MREHLLDRIAMTLSADVQWTFQVRLLMLVQGRVLLLGRPANAARRGAWILTGAPPGCMVCHCCWGCRCRLTMPR